MPVSTQGSHTVTVAVWCTVTVTGGAVKVDVAVMVTGGTVTVDIAVAVQSQIVDGIHGVEG